ncbi:hypothetical protein CB0940_06867 [Cercospora beticola]|uniref:Uncharacterized protein n=1 Tax=Cercospora beticola TaxID=122368 RepID=A0A2G5H986_CERBT|nr:hypothetical protein CB0940_06867 [Cercospora beticola]PIA89096.1 hypothetical protein CB0940_06867 [Cercospora beticola]
MMAGGNLIRQGVYNSRRAEEQGCAANTDSLTRGEHNAAWQIRTCLHDANPAREWRLEQIQSIQLDQLGSVQAGMSNKDDYLHEVQRLAMK